MNPVQTLLDVALNVGRQFPGPFPSNQLFRLLVAEGLDHEDMITEYGMNATRKQRPMARTATSEARSSGVSGLALSGGGCRNRVA